MDESLEQVRRDIESTRRALGAKISRLENKIETTTTTTLNPAYYVRTRPWPTLGAITVLGWMVGRSLRGNGGKGVRQPKQPSLVRDVIRSAASGAASVIGVVAGDLVRDFIKDRRSHPGH